MLSLHPQDFNSNPCYLSYRSLAPSPFHSDHSSLMPFTMGGAVQPPPTPQQDHMELDGPAATTSNSNTTSSSYRQELEQEEEEEEYYQDEADADSTQRPSAATISPPADYNNMEPSLIANALEVARDSPDGARDPIVCGILESALSQTWERVLANPEGYVMTSGEFAVFNFYQHRFVGNKLAVAARRRFWDNTHA